MGWSGRSIEGVGSQRILCKKPDLVPQPQSEPCVSHQVGLALGEQNQEDGESSKSGARNKIRSDCQIKASLHGAKPCGKPQLDIPSLADGPTASNPQPISSCFLPVATIECAIEDELAREERAELKLICGASGSCTRLHNAWVHECQCVGKWDKLVGDHSLIYTYSAR